MIIISMVVGGVLGLFAALFCWFVLDFTAWEAFGIYLIASIGCGALAAATSIARRRFGIWYKHGQESEA